MKKIIILFTIFAVAVTAWLSLLTIQVAQQERLLKNMVEFDKNTTELTGGIIKNMEGIVEVLEHDRHSEGKEEQFKPPIRRNH